MTAESDDQVGQAHVSALESLSGLLVDPDGTTVGDVLCAVPSDWADDPPALAGQIVELCEQLDAADVPGRVASLIHSAGRPASSAANSATDAKE